MSERFNSTASAIKLSQAIEKLSKLDSGTVVPIPLEYIDRSENIRRELDTDTIEFSQLVESIKEVGLLQNPVVTVSSGKILCVSGHRRIAAIEHLGHKKVECTLVHFENLELKDVAQIVENTARKGLEPFDLADQLLNLKNRGYSQVKLQSLIGKNRQVVGRYQKLALWPKELKEMAKSNREKFNVKALMQLSSINDHDELRARIEEILGTKKASTNKKARVQRLNESGVLDYCQSQSFSESQTEFLFSALRDLGIIKSKATDGKSQKVVHGVPLQ
ncbi:ParB/RepB/Spo0J family partition protein [Pseudobacteriovorax antillogorgiicola]|uniref:ParB/RepB/Spo0J family partition protein n=1 Tax=Pseudobacteriovorax antillogorgiicola TaxID=1513793 RepID=A0A1Y6CWQ6_9BACT|nr:ParB N-terminal domain-containing protein [Pseudobacteriovorax antillogorgiicola]TCS44213.1 ParB/RepB/Spo0J family partition protein [Pseudobacteriovorax antillogorgiicola]SMF80446.1 ParB/RepB/Spo0J family partition protein [Pseudobacteriovorax antillogorgiicola]